MNSTQFSTNSGQTFFLPPPSYGTSFIPSYFVQQPPPYYESRSGGEFGMMNRSNSRGRWNGVGTGNGAAGRGSVGGEERGRFIGRSVGRNEDREYNLITVPRTQSNAVRSHSDDHDHPSFSRPPHRTSQAGPPTSFEATTLSAGVEYQLVSNTCTVPPPPPIELSAVPLADLATEMVWKACLSAQSTVTTPSSPIIAPIWGQESRPQRSSSLRSLEELSSGRNSSPRTPELYYGAIGEGRLTSQDEGENSSSESSPSSSAPGTPIELLEPMTAKERLGLQFEFDGEAVDGIEAIRIHARKLSAFSGTTRSTGMGSEPTLGFRQFVKQILTATLISPEDLILALYFISKLPVDKLILPTKATGLDGLTERESAIKAAPFKLILGAIMLANKTLQDNSYRNETFAAVSGIPLKDVNALEVYLFGGLNFDVNISGENWIQFVESIVMKHRFGGLGNNIGNGFEVSRILGKLLNGGRDFPVPVRYLDEKSTIFF